MAAVAEEKLSQKCKLTVENLDESLDSKDEQEEIKPQYEYVTLLEDYYNLAVFAFFMREKHIDEEIAFEIKYLNTKQDFDEAVDNGTVTDALRRQMKLLKVEAELRIAQNELMTSRNGRVLFKCIIVLVMQILLALMGIQYFWTMQVVVVPPFFNDACIINVCLMYAHLQMQPKVEQALRTMMFCLEHPYNFRSHFQPFFITFMSFIAILLT